MIRPAAALAGLFLAALALGSAASAAPAANSFVVRGVNLFDGDQVRAGQTVVVRDGRIAEVGRGLPVPPGLPVVDGRGRTLLPGLIDAHVHVFPGAQGDALRFGVTTELDMFHLGPELTRWRTARSSLARTHEADTWSAGVGATAPGGHPTEFAAPGEIPTLSRPSEAEAFVAARVAAGSDYLKLFLEDRSEFPGAKPLPTLSRETVCALVAAAHARGKLAVAHVETVAAAREAIGCGADGLAHLPVDQPADPALVAEAKRRGVFVITTAGVFAGQSRYLYPQLLARDPRVARFIAPKERRILLADAGPKEPSFFPDALATLSALRAAGVPVLAGTDASNPGAPHGAALHEELQILVQAGFTPLEALRSATALPARLFNLGRRGAVKPGYRADLLLVRGDPTRDIADTLSIVGIWKNGYAVPRHASAAPETSPRAARAGSAGSRP